MKIKFHGALDDVDKSCIEVLEDNKRFLLDCGIHVGSEVDYPNTVENLNKIDAVFLAHAHLDHSGAIPFFFANGMKCPIYATSMTKILARMLYKDALKISHLRNVVAGYDEDHINSVLSSMKTVDYDKWHKLYGLKFKIKDSGHIPGSGMFLIQFLDQNLLYTSDINTSTRLLNGCDLDFPKIDVMILESTYGARDHPDRLKEEEYLLDAIQEILDRDGTVILPAFAVGKAQELMLILDKRNFGVPIYIDGMARDVLDRIRNYKNLKDLGALQKAMKNVQKVTGRIRKDVPKTQSIIITTSGMMTGGPINYYLEQFWFDKNSAIFLTGYQAEDTNGRMLLDEGKVMIEGVKTKWKGTYKKFEFSSHAGRTELHDIIKKINPSKLILTHGDKDCIDELYGWCKKEGLDVYINSSKFIEL